MQLAIQEAWKYQLLTYPNPAVGATVIKNNKILAVEAHHEAGLPHAEVLALKSAYLLKYPHSELKDLEQSEEIHNYLIKHHNDYFKDCEIYVTLEPCNHVGKTPACAILLEKISIKKVCIGTLDPNEKASGGKERLKKAEIEVEIGLNKKETDALLDPFLKFQKGHFIFFKMAIREDGTVDGGYITTQDSLNLVHEIRTKIDLMIVGGKTVRIDRPKLDSRFSKKEKTPDILIYSNQKEFDKTIPLFNIKNRKVTISSSLELIKNNNFVMIEGGYSLLSVLQNEIDYLLLFISHKESKKIKYKIDENEFEYVHSYFINSYDEIVFLKKVNGK
jgi:diaminohydroxyphosphoribosylaminopyrimidine deaminase/5-amino-6-(5-phosphoribosylamino)uracil reductase